ncbi:hypothetical protein [Pseudonocardia sp. ICBG601]|uniref:LexA family protein n=1 Tax=Pseudonocardia sp. ICBG601 TaxID=2846759 RepID=UPI0035ABA9F7
MDRYGYPPSVREIGDAVGLTSTSSVHTPAPDPGAQGLPPARPEPAPARRCPQPGADRRHRRVGLRRRHRRAAFRAAGAGVRAAHRRHRRRWPDPGRAGRAGRVPAAA